MKIIQIDGIKGLITAAVVCACAFAGFIISPGYFAMSLWNKYLTTNYMFPELSIFQGVLLWGIVVLTYFIVFEKGFALSFKDTPEMTDEEINKIIKSAKINAQMRMMNKIVNTKDKLEIQKKHSNSVKQTDEKDNTLLTTPISFSNKYSNGNAEDESVSNLK